MKSKKFFINVLKNKNGAWFWRLKARNGKILAHSEAYSSKAKALKTVESLILSIHQGRVVLADAAK